MKNGKSHTCFKREEPCVSAQMNCELKMKLAKEKMLHIFECFFCPKERVIAFLFYRSV